MTEAFCVLYMRDPTDRFPLLHELLMTRQLRTVQCLSLFWSADSQSVERRRNWLRYVSRQPLWESYKLSRGSGIRQLALSDESWQGPTTKFSFNTKLFLQQDSKKETRRPMTVGSETLADSITKDPYKLKRLS